MTQDGFSDRRSRPFRINVFITPAVRERGYISSSLPRRAPLGSFSKLRRPIGATMGQQRPGRARHLVGERHRHDLEGSPRQELREPGILPGILLGAPQHGDRPAPENAPQLPVPRFAHPSDLLPPPPPNPTPP